MSKLTKGISVGKENLKKITAQWREYQLVCENFPKRSSDLSEEQKKELKKIADWFTKMRPIIYESDESHLYFKSELYKLKDKETLD